MKRRLALLSLGLVAASLVVFSPRVVGQDAAKVAPDAYKVLLDNDRVRVLEVRLKAGDKVAMHSHPDYIVYNFEPCKVKFSSPDGSNKEIELKGGEASFRPAESHAVEN